MTVNGIQPNLVTKRIKEINSETPILWTTSLIKSPQELTVRTTARNNIMLENVLANQTKIIENQEKILNAMTKNCTNSYADNELGQNLSIVA